MVQHKIIVLPHVRNVLWAVIIGVIIGKYTLLHQAWDVQGSSGVTAANVMRSMRDLAGFLGALADLGGMPDAHPPKGPDSFVSTYKIFET